MHGDETFASLDHYTADSGYRGVEKREETKDNKLN